MSAEIRHYERDGKLFLKERPRALGAFVEPECRKHSCVFPFESLVKHNYHTVDFGVARENHAQLLSFAAMNRVSLGGHAPQNRPRYTAPVYIYSVCNYFTSC